MVKNKIIEKGSSWEEAVQRMFADPYARIAFERTSSVAAAVVAFQLRDRIARGEIGRSEFIALVKRAAGLGVR